MEEVQSERIKSCKEIMYLGMNNLRVFQNGCANEAKT